MKTAQDVRKREYEMFISIISLDFEANFFWTSELIGIMDRYKHDLGRSLVPSKPFVCLYNSWQCHVVLITTEYGWPFALDSLEMRPRRVSLSLSW